MPQVLVFSTHTSLDNRISKHLTTISEAGYDILYVNSHDDDSHLDIQGVKHVNLHQPFVKQNILGVLWALTRMRRIVRNTKDATILHIHDPLLLFVAKTAKKKGMKIVYDRHESYNVIDGLNGRLCAFAEKRFKKYIDGVVYVNSAQGEFLEQAGYCNLVKIPNYQSQNAYHKYQRISDDIYKITLVYFGVVNDVSRNSTLMLDVVERILTKYDCVKFEIGGKIEGQTLRDRICFMSEKYPGFYYCGSLKYEDVIKKTINADVGLYFQRNVPNNIGSSPNKIYEYLMAGVAICAIGRFSDWNAINNNAGVVLPYEAESNEVFLALEQIICDSEMLEAYKCKSALMARNYTWESVAGKYVTLYKTLLEE